MGVEIERRFLVHGENWRGAGREVRIRQGYLNVNPDATVRVRIAGGEAFLTVKGRPRGPARAEFEYPVPLDDAEAMLELCGDRVIEKTRTRIPAGDLVWEVDAFAGANVPLVLAEIELEDVDQGFVTPGWLGDEVTGDPRYANSNLAVRPFGTW